MPQRLMGGSEGERFPIFAYSPEEDTDSLGRFHAAQAKLFGVNSVRWGTMWAGMEGRQIVESRSFGDREVVAGVTWVALKMGLEGNLGDTPPRNPIDIMLDECHSDSDLPVLAVFDIAKLQAATGLPADMAHLGPEVESMDSQLRIWSPKSGVTLDGATRALFAYQLGY